MITNSEIKLPLKIMSLYHFLAPYEYQFFWDFFFAGYEIEIV